MDDMTSKDKYLESELSKSVHSFTSSLLVIGGLFILFLAVLDYLVTPESFPRFFLYRIIATSCYLLLFLLFKRIKKHPNFFIISAAVIVSAMVEKMVLEFGGHQSLYYAGMIVVFMFLFGLVPISFRVSLIIAGIIYASYLVPILLFDTITAPRIFISNNMFLLATIGGGLVWRYLNHRLLQKNLSLQYDLGVQTKSLKIHSFQLSSLVEDRTRGLNRSVQQYQALFENATDGIIVMDLHGTIQNANDRACEMHGLSKEALTGIHNNLLEVDEQRYKAADRMKRILAGESLVYETTHFKKDGTRIALEVSAKSILIADEMYIQAFLRDITERKKAEAEKARYQAEREKILKDLHDGIGGLTTNINLLAEIAQTQDDLGQVRRSLATISELSRDSLSEIRAFLQSLDVKDLTWQAVAAELRHLGNTIIEPHGIRFALTTSLPENGGGPGSMMAMNLFRIYKESLINIVKHARASAVEVSLVLEEKRVVFEVRDNGIGLAKDRGRGRGLLNMEARAAELGGPLTVSGRPGGGTAVALTAPL